MKTTLKPVNLRPVEGRKYTSEEIVSGLLGQAKAGKL